MSIRKSIQKYYLIFRYIFRHISLDVLSTKGVIAVVVHGRIEEHNKKTRENPWSFVALKKIM